MSLSDKQYNGEEIVAATFDGLYREKDIKKSIKELIEEIKSLSPNTIFNVNPVLRKIDKAFGDALCVKEVNQAQ